jgi:hypothetical protein
MPRCPTAAEGGQRMRARAIHACRGHCRRLAPPRAPTRPAPPRTLPSLALAFLDASARWFSVTCVGSAMPAGSKLRARQGHWFSGRHVWVRLIWQQLVQSVGMQQAGASQLYVLTAAYLPVSLHPGAPELARVAVLPAHDEMTDICKTLHSDHRLTRRRGCGCCCSCCRRGCRHYDRCVRTSSSARAAAAAAAARASSAAAAALQSL